MVVRIAGLGLSYAANVLISRRLGLQAFGEYAVALSWAMVLTLPAKAGFDNSALRYSAIFFGNEDFARLRGFVRFASLCVSVVALIIVAVIFFAGAQIVPVAAATRVWAALLVPALALLMLYSVVMRTAGRIVAAQFYEQILRPALVICAIAVAAICGIRLSPASAMALTTFAATGALLGLAIQLRSALRPALGHTPRYTEWRQWLAVSVPMLMLGVVQELMNQVDIILLGQFAGVRQAGLFAAAWRLASLVPFALVALATMAGPLIAAAYERRATDELHQVSSIVARASFAFALISAAVLYVFERPLLGMFGREFVGAGAVLGILLIGGIVNAFTGVVAYFLTLTGRERQGLVIFAGALVLSIGLNLLLIPRYGAVGAAVASSSATAAWNLVMLIYVRRTIGIDASALALPIRGGNRDDGPGAVA